MLRLSNLAIYHYVKGNPDFYSGKYRHYYCSTSKAIFITVLYSTIFPFSTRAFQLVTSIPLIFRIVLLARSSPFSTASCQLLSDVDIKSETLRTVVAMYNHHFITIKEVLLNRKDIKNTASFLAGKLTRFDGEKLLSRLFRLP